MRLRGFQVGDGAAIVDAWQQAMPRDPITAERFRDLVLLDPNFDADGLRVAEVDGRVVGAVAAMRRQVAMEGGDLEPEHGWITFAFVDPAVRRRGVGSGLLSNAFDWLRERGATQVHFSPYTPNYLLPGLDATAYPEGRALLERFGFTTRYEAVAMERDLTAYEPPHLEARNGYDFGTPETDELPALIGLARQFSADWARAIRESLAQGSPLERIVVARGAARELVGWAMHGTYANAIERFGPFGVHPSQRGAGLGRILLHRTLARMRAAGATKAWFLWTTADSPAGHLYTKAGFRVTRNFQVMTATLTET
ncbi:GNAT family N-acetyltransferase [Tenggerimyces flavus]|uniref:GNAT family N-acetyltransferase n=1 Tax=Tenggerimyces flavus TaxID=1708749 RepID=A0ABV7Y1U4_9ACTN|nr:GNAT family N-acetyltransferase [Tenggerimyces flavus]MBM7790919.1 GNAT superfamily N-acetyltransferase [Tenggerimyces flavus]